VIDEIQELAEQLNISIRKGSITENLIGRELLNAEAAYHERQADQLRKDHGLTAEAELRNLPAEELKERLLSAWKQVKPLLRLPTSRLKTKTIPV
jgi:hypothetical protein